MKPYIICHMATTVDGRIQPHRWPMGNVMALYEKSHNALKGQAWIVGRTTMQGFSSSKPLKKLKPLEASLRKSDFVGDNKAKSYAVAIDASGKCRWTLNHITGDHIIEVLSEKVSPTYLAHLRDKKVSYIFAGKTKIDLNLAMKKLYKIFGIRRALLEGGGLVNGSFLKEGLVDELSQLILPIADGSIETPALFDVEKGHTTRRPKKLQLKQVRRLDKNTLWLRYKVL